MLVLTRKANESVLIGEDIRVTVVRIRGNKVILGFNAPGNIRVLREELPTFNHPVKEKKPLRTLRR